MKKIVILEGGYNEEHEVSLNTSHNVQQSLKNMNLEFEVLKVNPMNINKILQKYDRSYLFFNALHGTYGEDGRVQKELETNNLIYTHSKFEASKNSFNKNFTKKILKKTEIPLLPSIIFNKSEIDFEKFIEFFNQYESFVIKPVSSGSSFGVKVFHSSDDINIFFKNYENELMLYKNHNEIMLEKYIKGRELTVGVIEKNMKSESLAVTEIVSNNEIYDYQAKYVKGLSKHFLPANLPEKIYNECLFFAQKAHDKLGCKVVSRSDFIYDEKKIFFLEINTQPGLTETSLIPEQLIYKSIDFDNFILEVIKSSS